MDSQPSPRCDYYSANVDGEFYVCGGRPTTKLTAPEGVYYFDPLLESWAKSESTGPSPPGLYDGACASADQYLYLYGGTDGSQWHGSLHQLDTESWTWEELSGIPAMKLSGCAMVTYDGKLVLFGGYGSFGMETSASSTSGSGATSQGTTFRKDSTAVGRGWNNDLHTFDLNEKGTWSSPPISGTRPPPCSHFTLTAVDDHCAVLFGGVQPGVGKVNEVYTLNLARMHWSRLDCPGDSPKVRSGHAAVCVNYGAELPQLLVIGGMDEEYKSLDDTWLLDVKCQKWREVKNSYLQPRHSHGAAAFSLSPGVTEVVIFGGDTSYTRTLQPIDNTTILRFESKQHPSTGGPLIWQLTETADSKVLGNRGRVRNKLSKLKERYAQIARTAEQKAKYAEEQLLLQKSNGQRNY